MKALRRLEGVRRRGGCKELKWVGGEAVIVAMDVLAAKSQYFSPAPKRQHGIAKALNHASVIS